MNNRYFQLSQQLSDTTVRSINSGSNPAGRSMFRDGGLNYDQFHIGIVVQSRAGTYDAHVRIGRKNPIPCIQLGDLTSHTSGHGINHSKLLQEGTVVLVYKPQSFGNFGLIVGAVPSLFAGKGDKEEASAFMLDPEPSAAAFTEDSYKDPMKDDKYWSAINANSGRALDVFPGEQVWVNELGVGMALLHLAVQMRASARAKLEMFALDDLVRLVTGQWQHFSAQGEEHIYNDYGYVTRERVGSMHQCEALGSAKFDTPIATEGSPDTEKAKECNWKAKQPEMVPHRRFHEFIGHMGGLYQFFVISPDDSKEQSTYGDQKDRGLAHLMVDDGGRIYVRSVSDIRFERCDMIAVPRKNKEPWDPAGEKLEDGYEPEKKEPFEWDKDDLPTSRPLRERDYFAWARKLTYLRFWELSDLNGKKDWILKEEADAEKPVDKYDVIIENEEDYTSWEEHISSFTLRKDGGITMRNNAGAEISLCGIDIVITCPGDIQLRPGGSLVTLAKEDVVLKAQHSVDVSATQSDVRIKAQKNLLLYSGATAVLEAGEAAPDGEGAVEEGGELPKGIIMRAVGENIVMWGKRLQFSFSGDMILEGIKGATTRLIMAVKELLGITNKTILLAQDSDEPGGLIAQGGNAYLFGEGAHIVAKSSASVIRGGKVGVFIDWVDMPTDPYASISTQANPLKAQLLDTDDWLGGFSADNRARIGFSYRSDKDYVDNRDYEVYESHWAHVRRKGGVAIGDWGGDAEIRKTLPWPGKLAYDAPSMLFELSEEVNIEDPLKGTPKKFADRKSQGGTFAPVTFRKYKG